MQRCYTRKQHCLISYEQHSQGDEKTGTDMIIFQAFPALAITARGKQSEGSVFKMKILAAHPEFAKKLLSSPAK